MLTCFISVPLLYTDDVVTVSTEKLLISKAELKIESILKSFKDWFLKKCLFASHIFLTPSKLSWFGAFSLNSGLPFHSFIKNPSSLCFELSDFISASLIDLESCENGLMFTSTLKYLTSSLVLPNSSKLNL